MSAPGVLSIPFIKHPVSRAQGEGLPSGGIYPVLSSCRALSALHLLYRQRNAGTCLRSDCQELANRPSSTTLWKYVLCIMDFPRFWFSGIFFVAVFCAVLSSP